MTHIRVKTAIKGLAITFIAWSTLFLLAEWQNANWPSDKINITSCFDVSLFPENEDITGSDFASAFDRSRCEIDTAFDQWKNLLTLAIIVEFLWLKSWMMGSMTRRWDQLGVSLILANVVFSVVYTVAITSFLFQKWAWIDDSRELLRYGLILTLLWGIVQLALVKDLEKELIPSSGLESRPPTSWERSARAAERTANATERIADNTHQVVSNGREE